MHRKAFTLIELLVVIAIIAILAAILFPVFAQAKMAAKKTQSLSNSKQINLGIQMYMNDQDDRFPTGSGTCWYYPTDTGWSWDTQPYIKNLPILQDPSDPKSRLYWPSWFVGQPVVSISYAGNGLIKWNGTANEAAGLMNMLQGTDMNGIDARGCGNPYAGGWYNGPSVVNGSAVNRVADTILIAGAFEKNNIFGPSDILTDGTYWDWATPQAIPLGTRNGAPYTVTVGSTTDVVNQDNRNGAVQTVYAGKGIFGFADGHAKTMPPVQTRPVYVFAPDDQDTQNMWNYKRP